MARTLKLYWGSTEKVDLLAAADGGAREVTWYPKSGRLGSDTPVVETINIQIDRASDDLLATSFQAVDEVRYWAQQYLRDPTSEDPVWLWAQMSGETGARRALVRAIDLKWLSDPMLATGHAAANMAKVQLQIEREPWWEETTVTGGTALGETAGTILTWDYLGAAVVGGDVPARIPQMIVSTDATGANVTRLWMGIRSANKHGTLANFAPLWECEDGTNNALDTGITDDAASDVNGASPGSGSGAYVELQEGGGIGPNLDWDTSSNGGIFQEVLEINLSQISANENDNFGDYLWLLRHKLAANATTWELQLRWGYSQMADADFVQGPIVEVSSTSWDYAEMGRQVLPLRNLHAIGLAYVGDGFEAGYSVQIWARRTSGAADLHLDCLCLVPIDEGWLKSWDFDLAAGAVEYWIYGEGEYGAIQAVTYGTSMSYAASLASNNFRFPIGDGRVYIVYAADAAHDLTLGLSVATLSYWERWANLRGSE
jgi:hypothetical protein